MLRSAFTAAVLICGILTGCRDPEPETAIAPPPPPPDSPPASSRGDLEGKVGPLVELAATRQGEPGRYDRLGAAQFSKLNSLSPSAALYIAASPRCDQLIDVDTRRSTPSELVWRGRCANGTIFTVFENDVKNARSRLTGVLTEASIRAIPPPAPDEGTEPGELDWLRPCLERFRGTLTAEESFLHDRWKLGRRSQGRRTLSVSGNISTDAFHEKPHRFECTGDVATGRVLEIR